MVIVIMLNLDIIHEIKMDMLITKVHLRDTFWPIYTNTNSNRNNIYILWSLDIIHEIKMDMLITI